MTAAPERDADELRARLVRAAAAVFAREGYAGTKIMDIVREAGVSTGTVYGRFRSKNELLREAVVGASARGGVLARGAPFRWPRATRCVASSAATAAP